MQLLLYLRCPAILPQCCATATWHAAACAQPTCQLQAWPCPLGGIPELLQPVLIGGWLRQQHLVVALLADLVALQQLQVTVTCYNVLIDITCNRVTV
jgi:hypothetical protein